MNLLPPPRRSAGFADAPTVARDYELRNIAEGTMRARRPITVSSGPVTMAVTWTGPAGLFDKIRLPRVLDAVSHAVASVRVVAGTDATLMAPTEPCVHVLNYVARSSGLVLGAASIDDAFAPAAGTPAPLRP